VHTAPATWGFALKRTLNCLGAWVAAASLLSGCIDPGPGSAKAPASPSSAGRAATLSWDAPTTNTDGTALIDLAGYRIYYGSSADNLNQSVQINTVGLQTYVMDDLEPGTWYFAVMAVTADGAESALSNLVVKTIT
jgi:hypothetical protein